MYAHGIVSAVCVNNKATVAGAHIMATTAGAHKMSAAAGAYAMAAATGACS